MIGTEEETARDGLLSSRSEVHALVLGLGAGLLSTLTGWPWPVAVVVGMAVGVFVIPSPKLRELRREPWYATAGAFVGAAPLLFRTVVEVMPWLT